MGSAAPLRPVASRPPVSVDGAGPSLPAPEDVFLAWLMMLPPDADVASAARREIARLDATAPLQPGPAQLRRLFVEAARSASCAAKPTFRSEGKKNER